MNRKPDRLGIILNPIAGRGKCGRWRDRLENQACISGREFVWLESEHPGHATKLATELIQMGIKTVVACGGDGTINEVGTALAGADGVQFGIVPLGCGNDFVRSISTPSDPEKAFQLILDNRFKTIRSDCGRINGRYFFNNLGIGFDGAVVVTAEKVNRFSNPYQAGVVRHIFTYREFDATLHSDGRERMNDPIFMFVASIGKAYGGGFYITPDAELGDGLMDVLVVPVTKRWKRPRLLWLVTRQKHLNDPSFRFFRAREVELDLKDNSVPAHVDGIRMTVTGRAKIELIPDALTIITGDRQP